MRMLNTVCVLVVLSIPTVVLAESIAVKESNYAIGIGYSEFWSNGKDISSSGSVAGFATLGIGQYGGASGYVNYQKSNYSSDNYKSASTSFGGLLFLRDASIGRVGLASFFTNTNIENKNTNIIPSDSSRSHSLFLDYYVNDFTVSLQRSLIISGFKDYPSSESNTSSLSGLWHATENIAIDLTAYGMDSKNNNSISVIYQPEFLGQSTSFNLLYFNDTSDSKSRLYFLSINYYFNTRVSLKERERNY